MTVKDHGEWEEYYPDTPPSGVPVGALLARRVSDHMDWYDYVHNTEEPNFEATTVKFLLEIRDGQVVIKVPVVEADRMFPAGCQLMEMMDIQREQNEAALINEFANHFFDVATGEVSEEVWMPSLPGESARMTNDELANVLESILERLEKLEARNANSV